MGVHHGDGVRELFFAFVVVGDDHVHTQAGGVSRLGQGGDAAVHGDDEGHALQRQLLHGLVVHAVALGETVGDVIAHVAPLRPEIMGEQTGGGDAVHVVVAVDGDRLLVAQRPPDAGGRQIHVFHQVGVAELILCAGQQSLGLI